jgi:hypothetical protein
MACRGMDDEEEGRGDERKIGDLRQKSVKNHKKMT